MISFQGFYGRLGLLGVCGVAFCVGQPLRAKAQGGQAPESVVKSSDKPTSEQVLREKKKQTIEESKMSALSDSDARGGSDAKEGKGTANPDGTESQTSSKESDLDEDGVLGAADKCPEQPEDRDGYEDKDGCPDYDNDGDGLRDTEDDCPDEPETLNAKKDGDGCPDGQPKDQVIRVSARGIELQRNIPFFKARRSRLTRGGKKALQQVASALKNHRRIQLVVIRGQGDGGNSKSKNMKLAKRRAQEAYRYLVRRGIAKERLQFTGVVDGAEDVSQARDDDAAPKARLEFEIRDTLSFETLLQRQQLAGEGAGLPRFRPKALAVSNKLTRIKKEPPMLAPNGIVVEVSDAPLPAGIREQGR